MPDMKGGVIAFVVFVAVMGPFIGWVIWQSLPQQVQFVEGSIVRTERGRRESVALADIERVRFHYSAVAGFIGSWEFFSKDGSSLNVSGEAKGIEQVLPNLEKSLPGFSMAEFRKQFEAADVEDTIEVWRRHA